MITVTVRRPPGCSSLCPLPCSVACLCTNPLRRLVRTPLLPYRASLRELRERRIR